MHRLVQQKSVDAGAKDQEVWFNRSPTQRSRCVPATDVAIDAATEFYSFDAVVKTKRGLRAGRVTDKDGFRFKPDGGRQFFIQRKQVYAIIVETHERTETGQ